MPSHSSPAVPSQRITNVDCLGFKRGMWVFFHTNIHQIKAPAKAYQYNAD